MAVFLGFAGPQAQENGSHAETRSAPGRELQRLKGGLVSPPSRLLVLAEVLGPAWHAERRRLAPGKSKAFADTNPLPPPDAER